MRRIYESDAIHRDDDEPFSPREQADAAGSNRIRAAVSAVVGGLAPGNLRHRAISVTVSTPRSTYPVGTTVPFRVTMTNTMPFPVTITVDSPILWNWAVDGVTEASQVPLHDPPDERRDFHFERSERKRFTKQWPQTFRVAEAEWEDVDPGTYTISAALNVADPEGSDLYDETTITIDPDAE
jgi:hypothetical protein